MSRHCGLPAPRASFHCLSCTGVYMLLLLLRVQCGVALQVARGPEPDLQHSEAHKATSPAQTSGALDATGFHLSNWAWKNIQDANHLLLHSDVHRLMFCMIPKNACTEFLGLVMRLDGFTPVHWNPSAFGRKQLSIHYDTSREKLFFKGEERARLENILRGTVANPWVRAVVLRDPADRLLSAYYSKVVRGYYDDLYPKTMSLEDFVSRLEAEGVTDHSDPHFRPQSYLCGLNETLEQFDIIGKFEDLEGAAESMIAAISTPSRRLNSTKLLMEGWGPDRDMPLFGVPREQREAGHEAAQMMMPVTHARWEIGQVDDLSGTDASQGEPQSTEDRESLAQLRDYLVSKEPLHERVKALYDVDYALLERAEKKLSKQATVT